MTLANPATSRRMRPPERYEFAATVAPLVLGRYDPAARFAGDGLWWTARTPDGPGTLYLCRDGADLAATGYGPGAAWLVEHADAVAGLRDDLTGLAEVAGRHPAVAEAYRRHPELRLPRTGMIFPHLVQAILAQKVTGMEAARGYVRLVRHFGEPAPGPVPGLMLPPDPQRVAAAPYWAFHPFGIERKRADAICRAAREAGALSRCGDAATATARMTAVPGIGVWTAAEVVRPAFGDPDAVSVGDYHLPHQVAWALAGQVRAGSRVSAPGTISPADARMLELLAPFAGQRARVCLLLLRAGLASAPRFGPRLPVRSFARF